MRSWAFAPHFEMAFAADGRNHPALSWRFPRSNLRKLAPGHSKARRSRWLWKHKGPWRQAAEEGRINRLWKGGGEQWATRWEVLLNEPRIRAHDRWVWFVSPDLMQAWRSLEMLDTPPNHSTTNCRLNYHWGLENHYVGFGCEKKMWVHPVNWWIYSPQKVAKYGNICFHLESTELYPLTVWFIGSHGAKRWSNSGVHI